MNSIIVVRKTVLHVGRLTLVPSSLPLSVWVANIWYWCGLVSFLDVGNVVSRGEQRSVEKVIPNGERVWLLLYTFCQSVPKGSLKIDPNGKISWFIFLSSPTVRRSILLNILLEWKFSEIDPNLTLLDRSKTRWKW